MRTPRFATRFSRSIRSTVFKPDENGRIPHRQRTIPPRRADVINLEPKFSYPHENSTSYFGSLSRRRVMIVNVEVLPRQRRMHYGPFRLKCARDGSSKLVFRKMRTSALIACFRPYQVVDHLLGNVILAPRVQDEDSRELLNVGRNLHARGSDRSLLAFSSCLFWKPRM